MKFVTRLDAVEIGPKSMEATLPPAMSVGQERGVNMTAFLDKDPASAHIFVAGAGAIGLTIATRMRLQGFGVSLIARGDSLACIRKHGVQLIDRDGNHRMPIDVGLASDFSKADILFLCPKSYDMPAMAAAVRHLISADTIVVPVINGIPWWYFDGSDDDWNGRQIRAVDPDGLLKQIIPSRQIVGATTTMTVERIQPGTARTSNPLQMTIGELDDRPSARLDFLEALLDRSGILTNQSPRIRNALWTKVVRNLISNPITAITGATLRQNFGNLYLIDIARQVLGEVLPVIAAYQACLEVDPETILKAGRKMGDVKTSMLQDLEKGNRLEIASICDAVIELAHLRGLDMPITKVLGNLVHFKSARNREAMTA